MRCPHCKTQNRDGSLLCERCGRSLTTDSSFSTNSVTAEPEVAGHSSISVTPIQEPAVNSTSLNAPSLTKSSLTEASPAGIPAAALPPPQSATNASFSSAQTGPAMDTRQFADGEAYTPSGRSGSGAGLRLFASAIVAGLFVGGVYYFVSRFINLIILFPLIAGAIAGAILAAAVHAGKVRNPRLATVNALICGVLVVLTMQGIGAMSARAELVDAFTEYAVSPTYTGKDGKTHEFSESELKTAQAKVRPAIDAELTPLRTLVIYEKFRGLAGSELKHNGVGPGMKMSGGMFWALEGLEALLLIGACVGVASSAARDPFCEGCDAWHKSTNVLKVHPSQNELLWPQIAAQNWKELLATPVGQTMDNKNQTTISVTSCPTCHHGTISAATTGGKVPPEFVGRRLSPESTRDLLQTSAPPAV